MTTRVLVLCGCVLCLSIAAMAGELTPVKHFGEEFSGDLATTPIGEILRDPDGWVGKRVRIAGEISGVCTKQGCWMDLTSTDDATLRVKVDDVVIVFPQEGVGHLAQAEGKIEILDLERDKYEAWLRHVAEEEGRAFNPAAVGETPYRIVRLRGLGAEITGL